MDVWRELPVINPGQEPLPGTLNLLDEYYILHTSYCKINFM